MEMRRLSKDIVSENILVNKKIEDLKSQLQEQVLLNNGLNDNIKDLLEEKDDLKQ